MQFTGVLPSLAPLATGHPHGLPAPADGPPTVTRVQPVAEQANIGTDAGTDHEPPREARLLQARQKESHSAPPSVVQIRIAKLLQEQAEKMVTERDTVQPAETAEAPEQVQTEEDLPQLIGPDPAAQSRPEDSEPQPSEQASRSAPPLPVPYGARATLSQQDGGGTGIDKTS